MPKETVISTTGFDENVSRGLRAEIHWGRDGQFVQLATVADELPQQSGFGAQGWFVTLDRNGVNAMIRHLRRARDQAFGRDE